MQEPTPVEILVKQPKNTPERKWFQSAYVWIATTIIIWVAKDVFGYEVSPERASALVGAFMLFRHYQARNSIKVNPEDVNRAD